MFLNVLIADDEYFIRQRLKKIICWDKLGLQCIGEAENGQEVIEKITEQQVDILLLDIKMPMKTGIEVAEYIMNNNINTKIIILTGYNDFDYAHKALKLKVVDFLVKPINKDTLVDALMSCKETIIASLEKQKKIHDYHCYKKRTTMYNVIMNHESVSDLYKKHPEMSNYKFLIFIGIFCPANHDQCIKQFVNKMDDSHVSLEYYKENEYISIMQLLLNNASIYDKIIDKCTNFIEHYSDYVFISLGNITPIKESWLHNYQSVWNALYQRYFENTNKMILVDTISKPTMDKNKCLAIRKKLLLSLNSKNVTSLNNLVDTIFITIEKVASKDYLLLLLTELFVTLKINYPNNFKSSKSVNSFVQELISEDYSLDNLKELVKSYALQCMDQVSHERPSNVILVNKITDYIDQHYTSPTLSVTEISDFFELNSTYLGSIFKKITDQSILKYITYLRMEKAKELLNIKKYNVTQISEMVGYSDVFYFSKKFKKINGCSPKNFS